MKMMNQRCINVTANKDNAMILTTGKMDTNSSTYTIANLQAEVASLQKQLAESQVENDRKDKVIESLQAQVKREHSLIVHNNTLQTKLDEFLRSRLRETERKHTSPHQPVRDVVCAIQRWLFLEGGNLRDVKSLITEYSKFCQSLGMPLDRLFVAGMMLHPQVSAYVWKWEIGEEFNEHEVPHSAFEKPNYNPDEPFAVLMEGRAMEYRMRADDKNIPPGCSWFKRGDYQDYFALPIYHRGEYKGSMAWCTKSPEGFSKQHVEIFKSSLTALSTVLRLHTNDLVMTTLMSRLQEEVTKQTKELEAANKSLAAANQRVLRQGQNQLKHFAMMSHEIRTPLNCIVGLSNLLLDSNLDPSVEESIEMITSSGDLLLAVVDDVLDYSKLATGKVETIIQPTNLRKTINAVVASVSTKARMTGLELRTEFDPQLPEKMETDGRRLQQILYNLLGNAVKFGARGKSVEFSIYLECDALGKKHVKFAIKDYGKGIAPTEMQKIFEPFQQAATNEPAHGGTGLGLTITRQLVRVLGGNISVESEFGKWCVFVVKLPFHPIPDTQEEVGIGAAVANIGAIRISQSASTGGDDMTGDADLAENASSVSSSSYTQTTYSASYASSQITGYTNRAPPMITSQIIGMTDRAPMITSQITKITDIPKVPPPMLKNPPERPTMTRVPSSVLTESFDKIHILIAEDNTINQKVLNRTLNRIGLEEIDIVDNGQKAVEAAASKVYDIIFMDLQMPVMDGLEATRIITRRRNENGQEFPKIVFLTAHALQDYQAQAADAGGDGFISKPFKIDIIRDLIRGFQFGLASPTTQASGNDP
jgi:signal transduction histidine kinase/ActR/RegA family two-component response regulator